MQKTLRTPAHRALQRLLIERRKSLELTQREVASMLHRPQSFVAKYETGERKLDLVEFCAVARALKAEPVALFDQFVKAVDSRRAGLRINRAPGAPRRFRGRATGELRYALRSIQAPRA